MREIRQLAAALGCTHEPAAVVTRLRGAHVRRLGLDDCLDVRALDRALGYDAAAFDITPSRPGRRPRAAELWAVESFMQQVLIDFQCDARALGRAAGPMDELTAMMPALRLDPRRVRELRESWRDCRREVHRVARTAEEGWRVVRFAGDRLLEQETTGYDALAVYGVALIAAIFDLVPRVEAVSDALLDCVLSSERPDVLEDALLDIWEAIDDETWGLWHCSSRLETTTHHLLDTGLSGPGGRSLNKYLGRDQRDERGSRPWKARERRALWPCPGAVWTLPTLGVVEAPAWVPRRDA